MKILAIESSCDETAAAVVEDGKKVLSSIVASQIQIHRKYGGVVPEIASRNHVESIVKITKEALRESNLTLKEIDAIGVTYAPGLIGALLVGVNFAKGLSLSTGLPLIPVHHLRAHIAANYITNEDLKPKFLCLVVSGGHSHIVEVIDYTNLRVIGKTRDDAAGEVFDKVARSIGLPYPGGIYLDKAAEYGNDSLYEFPRPTVSGAEYDFSFSGLKTSAINKIHNAAQKNEVLSTEDLSASFRKAVVDCLVKNFIKAAKDLGYKKLAVAGGVSANRLLRRKLKEECDKIKAELYLPDISLCGDNAAMVGSQAYYEFLSGNISGMQLNAFATKEIDGLT